MQITVAAVGRMKSSPAAQQWQDYAKRLTWPISLKEVEMRKKTARSADGAWRGRALERRRAG